MCDELPSLVRGVGEGRPDIPLFPCLTKLRLTQDVPGPTDALSVISPSLKSLHVVFRSPDMYLSQERPLEEEEQFVGELMREFGERAPSLAYLRMSRRDSNRRSWLHMIGHFSHVHEAYVHDTKLDPVVARPITLQYLKTLKLRLPFHGEQSSLAVRHPPDRIPSLAVR